MTVSVNHPMNTQVIRSSEAQSLRTVAVVIAALSGIVTLVAAYLGIIEVAWQFFVLSGLFFVSFITSAVTASRPKDQIVRSMGLVAAPFAIAMIGAAAFLDGLGIVAAINYLIFSLILSSTFRNTRSANRTTLYGIISASICALLTEFSPFPQIVTILNQIYPAILGILFMVYIVLLAMQYVAATLRVRLVSIFLAISVLPVAIVAFSQSNLMYANLSEEKNRALKMAADQAASRIDIYLNRSREALRQAGGLEVFKNYLELPDSGRQNSLQEYELRKTLQIIDIDELDNPIYMSSYAVIDANGYNVFDTYSDIAGTQVSLSSGNVDPLASGKGAYEGAQDYFLVPFKTAASFISPLYIRTQQLAFFYISAPIKNDNGEVIGVLRMRNDGLLLQQLIREFNNLSGSNTYAMLLDENNIRLADGFTPQYLFRLIAPLSNAKIAILRDNRRLPDLPDSMVATNYPEFARALATSENNPYFTTDIDPPGDSDEYPEVGAISSLTSMPWKLVYLENDYNDAIVRKQESRMITLLATAIALVVGIIAVFGSQLLSRPIVQLTETAQRISQGDLEAEAPSESPDEFGLLGSAFNSMTTQIRSLINDLEARVQSRTQEIANQNQVLVSRARQLQTVADVARQIVSVQELESLLSSVTRLISDRFEFYHVGIFLLDENKEFAVLRAANSEGGQRMLARHHMLPVGRVGIVGNVTGSGHARIATDVGEDAVFFNNPDLPHTRSEMALPLKVGSEIIGALDIQSIESDAFHEDDIELFNTLADQVAIAIYNNQLYSETSRALNEAQTLHRQYLHDEWEREVAARKVNGFLYNRMGVKPQETELPEWKSVLTSGQPKIEVASEGSENTQATMTVPINVRGETLGVIHLQDTGEDRSWTEDEIAVVNDVAGQVAVALENARLFEATSRRAEREKKVLEITAMIRSTNEPGRMMQIAVNELQRALGASRAQIYVRRSHAAGTPEIDPSEQHSGGNGGNGHTPDHQPGNS